jgi:hypothetical protein
MDFFKDKRFWYAIGALIVVVIVVAVVWQRSLTMAPPAPATTNSPATTPTAPSTTAPKQ